MAKGKQHGFVVKGAAKGMKHEGKKRHSKRSRKQGKK